LAFAAARDAPLSMMLDLASLGDADIFLPAVLLFTVWLWAVGLGQTLRGFLVGLGIVTLATVALKWLFATPAETTLWPDGTLISQYFPSGHAALATAVYGSLSVILAAAGGGRWRYTPMLALALAVAIAASRVVTRMHPLGDAFFGVMVGLLAPLATYFAVIRERKPFPAAIYILGIFVATLAIGWISPAPLHAMLPR
jgi:membrane-associated phospholipid phosphatase